MYALNKVGLKSEISLLVLITTNLGVTKRIKVSGAAGWKHCCVAAFDVCFYSFCFFCKNVHLISEIPSREKT